jgi:hypothetical protein
MNGPVSPFDHTTVQPAHIFVAMSVTDPPEQKVVAPPGNTTGLAADAFEST